MTSPLLPPDLDLRPVRRALLSVTDKTGLVEFAQGLAALGIDLVSTGGTARLLRESNLSVRDIADLTGFPEMLDGRVKTLHPRVHGALLHRRRDPAHVAAVAEHGIEPIDLVVVNLYNFTQTAANPDATVEDLIENIDIGGPSMIRSAAKNFEDVAILTSPADYASTLAELQQNNASLPRETRWDLARKAFATTAAYDTAIAATLAGLGASKGPARRENDAKSDFPPRLEVHAPLAHTLRYGENPHQTAALYRSPASEGIAAAEQLQGKELSFNNLVDLDACWALASEFKAADEAAVAIIKHTNPCGAATGATPGEAYQRALACDPVSAFGSVIGLNRSIDGEAAREIAKLFVEAIAAPDFTPEALEIFASKKNLRLLRVRSAPLSRMLKQISGGYLLQDADVLQITEAQLQIPTQRKPSPAEVKAMLFAWRVCKHVKSNAIVYARPAGEHGSEVYGQTVGIGAGQMSRVDAARFGAMKATLPLQGTVAASDAFFPFADGLEAVAEAGATAVIQPGGSVRDAEVIAAADRLGVAMAFTGVRHFRHG